MRRWRERQREWVGSHPPRGLLDSIIPGIGRTRPSEWLYWWPAESHVGAQGAAVEGVFGSGRDEAGTDSEGEDGGGEDGGAEARAARGAAQRAAPAEVSVAQPRAASEAETSSLLREPRLKSALVVPGRSRRKSARGKTVRLVV